MADGLSQVDIAINTRADVSGAQQAQASLEGVEQVAAETQGAYKGVADDSEKAGEQAEEFTQRIRAQSTQLTQTIFQAHRFMEGLKDISEGGRLASQGFVDLEETLARFLPVQAQVGLALASGAALLYMMATRHRGAGAAAREHAAAEKEAAAEIASAQESFTQEYVGALGQVLAAQEKVNKAEADELEMIREKRRLADGQIKLDEKAAIEQLRAQYLVDEQKPGLTDRDRKRLRERYEAGAKDIEEQGTVHTADAEVKEKQEDYDARHQDVLGRIDQRRSNQQMIDDAMELQQRSRETVEGFGLKPNEKGELTDQNDVNAVERMKQAVADATDMLKEAQHPSVRNVGTSGAYVPDVDPQDVARRQRDLRIAQENYDALTSAQQNYNVGTETQKAVQPKIDADSDAIKKDEAGLSNTLAELLQAIEAARQARIDLHQDRTQTGIDQGVASVDDAARDKKTADEAAKKKDDEAKRATEAAARAARQQATQHTHAETEEEKTLRGRIENAQGNIEASGNKPLIEAMRRFVDSFKGRTDEASETLELAGLLNLHVSQTQATFVKVRSEIEGIKAKMRDTRNRQ